MLNSKPTRDNSKIRILVIVLGLIFLINIFFQS